MQGHTGTQRRAAISEVGNGDHVHLQGKSRTCVAEDKIQHVEVLAAEYIPMLPILV